MKNTDTDTDPPCDRHTPTDMAVLVASSEELAEAVRDLSRTVRFTRRWALIATALTLGLAVGLGWVAYVQQQVAVTQNQATRTREQVLCPLYTLFLAAVSAAPPNPGRPAQAAAVIREGYEVLDCARLPLRPPPH